MMFEPAGAWPDRAMLRWHDGCTGMDWTTLATTVASAARNLGAAGGGPGDRVLILAENRPKYPIAQTALLCLRAMPIPTCTTSSAEDQAFAPRDSCARAAVSSSCQLASRMLAAAGLEFLVTMAGCDVDGLAVAPPTRHLPWSTLTRENRDFADVALDVPASTLACLLYTCGTSGSPRASARHIGRSWRTAAVPHGAMQHEPSAHAM